MHNQEGLKEEMIQGCIVILRTVDWLEIQINKKTLEYCREIERENYDKAESLRKEAYQLLGKLAKEDKNMADFIIKYKNLIKNEKEALLFNLVKGKAANIRRVPKNQRGKSKG